MKNEEKNWIDQFDLKAHPEGGYFSEVYRSPETIPSSGLPDRYSGSRAMSTSIYFLIPEGDCSRLHRLKTDEVWHFYAGGPLLLYMFREGMPTVMRRRIGPGGPFQAMVPRGWWFGARPAEGYSLVGCTMAPGFDFADFELADRETMLKQFPQHEDTIRMLT